MKNLTKIYIFFSTTIILFVSTSSKIEIKNIKEDGSCDKTIKYFVSKISAGGQEMDVKLTVIVNPAEKSLTAEMEGQDKRITKLEIEECKLNADLTSGYSVYKVIYEGGETEWMKIESNDGKISISNPKPTTDDDNMSMTVDKWEVVK